MWTYFIQASRPTGPIKIGSSHRPSSRLATLQTASYEELCLLGVVKSEGEFSESSIHTRFSRYWIRGEWFRPGLGLRQFIHTYATLCTYESLEDVGRNQPWYLGMDEEYGVPILRAFQTAVNEAAVWCPYCLCWHFHTKENGHRAAHCFEKSSKFRDGGYVLKVTGPWPYKNSRPASRSRP